MIADPLVYNILKNENIKSKLTDISQKFVNIFFGRVFLRQTYYEPEFSSSKDKLLATIEATAQKACIEFPRFYFLSKEMLIETLSYSRDCRKFLNAIRLCFPGVYKLNYRLPKSVYSNGALNSDERTSTSSLDTDLNFDIFGRWMYVS
jgi:hypothetical protein